MPLKSHSFSWVWSPSWEVISPPFVASSLPASSQAQRSSIRPTWMSPHRCHKKIVKEEKRWWPVLGLPSLEGACWEAWWQLGLVASQQLERPSLPRPASCCVGPTPRITRMPTRPQYNVPSIKMQHHHHHHPHNRQHHPRHHPPNHQHHHHHHRSHYKLPSAKCVKQRNTFQAPPVWTAQYKNAPIGDPACGQYGLVWGSDFVRCVKSCR